MAVAVLEGRGIVKEFPGVRALDAVDFDLQRGEIHALLGENGAGKSTLVNVLTGIHHPDNGEIFVEGEPVRFNSAGDAAARGIAVIHQDMLFAPHLSVATNISLDDIPTRRDLLGRLFQIVDQRAVEARASKALAAVGRPVSARVPAAELSVAQSQLVQIGRALSGHLTTLLLDEPTSSLSPSERDVLFGHLRRLRDGGLGVLYISHRLDEVVEIADRATVLRDGRVVGQLSRGQLSIDRVASLMLGGSTVQRAYDRAHSLGDPVLEVRGLTREPAYRNIDLAVRSGEIVGLTGLIGAGRTEVLRSIYGVDSPGQGEVFINGRHLVAHSAEDGIRAGMGLLTEDRKSQGVFSLLNVRDNVILGPLARDDTARRLTWAKQWIRRSIASETAREAVRVLRVRPPSIAVSVGTMSGGNQQKTIIARWLAANVSVLLLDEPTRGVDVGAKAEIWYLIHQLAESGAAVLVVSSEVPEVIAHTDRIIVMKAGEIAGELDPKSATEEEVMILAGGRD